VLRLARPVDVYLCIQPTDMRKSFNGLWALAVEHLGRDPLGGGLFVFVNRRRDLMKLLYWDADGIALWCKRLECGSFQMPNVDENSPSATLSATELTLLLRGIDLKSVRRRKRYRHERA